MFIQPSCYAANMDCEGGAPTTLFNAMKVGLPIITTDHCDIPFVVTQNKTGKLVKEKDVKALAKAMEIFLTMSNEDYVTYSEASIADVQERFNIKTNSQNIKSIYKDIKNSTERNISIGE